MKSEFDLMTISDLVTGLEGLGYKSWRVPRYSHASWFGCKKWPDTVPRCSGNSDLPMQVHAFVSNIETFTKIELECTGQLPSGRWVKFLSYMLDAWDDVKGGEEELKAAWAAAVESCTKEVQK